MQLKVYNLTSPLVEIVVPGIGTIGTRLTGNTDTTLAARTRRPAVAAITPALRMRRTTARLVVSAFASPLMRLSVTAT